MAKNTSSPMSPSRRTVMSGGGSGIPARRGRLIGKARNGRRTADASAHPNSRFTARRHNAGDRPDWQNPEGLPLSAICSAAAARHHSAGERAFDWEHGVFLGSACVRRPRRRARSGRRAPPRPFAMLPFCGYNMADYFLHWLSFGQRTDRSKLPKVYS